MSGATNTVISTQSGFDANGFFAKAGTYDLTTSMIMPVDVAVV